MSFTLGPVPSGPANGPNTGGRLRAVSRSVTAQSVHQLALRHRRAAFDVQLARSLPQVLDRPVLVGAGLSAAAADLTRSVAGGGVSDARGLLLAVSFPPQGLVLLVVLDARSGLLASRHDDSSNVMNEVRRYSLDGFSLQVRRRDEEGRSLGVGGGRWDGLGQLTDGHQDHIAHLPVQSPQQLDRLLQPVQRGLIARLGQQERLDRPRARSRRRETSKAGTTDDGDLAPWELGTSAA